MDPNKCFHERDCGKPKIIVAITGASGSVYGFKLLKALEDLSYFSYLIISKPALKVIRDELGLFANLDGSKFNSEDFVSGIKSEVSSAFGLNRENFDLLKDDFLEAKISSGSSNDVAGMVVVPCSMGSLSRIACGNSGNLIERAADVMLKERKKLIVCPRETPFNDIHLRNMLSLFNSGAVILPPIPGFYNKPSTIDDITGFITGKILDSLGIKNNLYERWNGHD